MKSTMYASQDDASTIECLHAKMLTLFAKNAKERAACLTMAQAHCDAVGKHYPAYILKNRAAPVSSLRADARHRHRESVARPGRAVRRSAASARPRGRRTIASRTVEMRAKVLDSALPLLEGVIQHAPHINALAMDVGTPAPRDETSAHARTRLRFRGTASRQPRVPAPTP